jgi:hypothetical protein
MREIRLSGSEGGGDELNRLSLPLSARRVEYCRPSCPSWPSCRRAARREERRQRDTRLSLIQLSFSLSTGSTRDALSAGIALATSIAATNRAADPPKATGSMSWMP